MNGRDLLINLEEECFKTGHFNKIKQNYKIIQESLVDFNIANYFFQTCIKESEDPSSSTFKIPIISFELCFINSQFIHDITIKSEGVPNDSIRYADGRPLSYSKKTSESISHSIVDISSISKLDIETDSETSEFDFNLYGKSDGIILFYSLDQSRFEEINKFKNELLKIITARSKTI